MKSRRTMYLLDPQTREMGDLQSRGNKEVVGSLLRSIIAVCCMLYPVWINQYIFESRDKQM
jgi:hypothetical protein